MGADARLEAAEEIPPDAVRSLLPIRGYTVVAEIARGGMGIVYRAEQWAPRRELALKMLLPFAAASREMRERFQREAQALTELEHPAILPIYEMGVYDGLPWFTMKLAAGGSLAERVGRFRGRWREIATLVARLCDAVQFAHDRGILHRDLKPGNILFDDGDQPFVADFGLAKLLREELDVTVTRLALGTPSYLAPELASGSASRATVASDVYSLGAVCFELLVGRPPFVAASLPALLTQIVREEARFPDDAAVPRDLRVITLRALAKDPSRRYASARELADELRRFLAGEPIQARPAPFGEKAWRWAWRNPALAGSLAACVVFATGGVVGVLRQLRQTESARAVAVEKTAAEHEQRMRAETALREVEESELALRLNLYAADMLGVQRALAQHDLGTARLLLDSHRPREGQPDLRGFEWRHFWGQSRPGNFATLSHEGHEVSALAFSPDGTKLAYASRQVMLHDTERFELVARVDMPSTQSLSFVDGAPRLLFMGNRMRDVHLWMGQPDVPLLVVLPRIGRWPNVAVAPGVSPLVVAIGTQTNHSEGIDGTTAVHTYFDVHELRTGGRRRVLPESGGVVAFSRDGRHLATGSWKDRITIWNPADGSVVQTLTNARRIVSLRFSPDGRTLVACSFDDSVWLYDVATGTQKAIARAHAGRVVDAEISPDGRSLATVSTDQTVRVWDIASGRQTALLLGHSYTVQRVAWSNDGRVLASGGQDGTVRLWRPSEIATRDTPIAGRARRRWAAPDGRHFLVTDAEGRMRLHAYPGLQAESQPQDLGQPLRFNAEGDTLFTLAGQPGTVKVSRWTVPGLRPGGSAELRDVDPSLRMPTLSEDGRHLAAGLGRGEIGVWDLASAATKGLRLQLPVPQAAAVTALEFSPDGRRLAASFMDSTTIYVWELSSKPTYRELPGHKGFVRRVVFSADGGTLLSGDGDKFIKLWDVESGKERGALLGHREGVLDLDMSPDGRTVVSVSSDRTLRLWNVATLREVARFELPAAGLDVAFTPDGTGLLYSMAEADGMRTHVLRAPGLDETDAVKPGWQ